jgi:hypothetical protein
LLAVLFVPLFTTLFALTAQGEQRLPACCRRGGAHHCMEAMQKLESAGDGLQVGAIHAPCPFYPHAVVSVSHAEPALVAASLLFAEVVSHPALHAQTEAWARVAEEGARHKRGPPAVRPS